MATRAVDELSEEPSGPASASPALAWAAERFQFDPGNPHSPQSGVEAMQKWLIGQNATVALDAMLGPQTLAALERAFAADEASAAVKEDLGIKAGEPAREEASGAETAASPSASQGAAASARPVALSDSAVTEIEQDRLGFRPYVEAVAEFILAEQTRPPLALAINAPWGQGKTSFMRMLDTQLRRAAPRTTVRVATTWFNPWKYSEPEQVWAAFVANVTRCLRDHLTRRQSWRFRLKRLATKLHRQADLAFVLRVIVALIFLSLVASAAFMDWSVVREALLADQKILKAFYTAATSQTSGYLWYLPLGLVMLLAVVYAYVALSNKLGLNLLEYVEKTGFKDKIGTLSQFEHEMLELREAVPDDLKVVVFIDDLDRCKGKVLGEIIEALQLAEVSHTCIFVMGMDMHIVASAIETERSELALSAGGAARMEHGSGYKFLEKIIQARLTLPTQGPEEMERLVAEAMAREDESAVSPPAGGAAVRDQVSTADDRGSLRIVDQVRQSIGLGGRDARETPSDSDTVIDVAKLYGSRHFGNPRRLKRFINGFRMQTYLSIAVRPEATRIDRLARFLVMAEKWPAVVDYMLDRGLGSTALQAEESDGTAALMIDEIGTLAKDEREKLLELLDGTDRGDPLSADEWRDLADWYGFGYYRGIVPDDA